MSYCTFLATDHPLYSIPPQPNQRLYFDLSRTSQKIDHEADPYITAFPDVSCYTDLRYGAMLDPGFSDAMAAQYIHYAESFLGKTERLEIWRVWLMGDYYEIFERPIVRRFRIKLCELTVDILRELYDAEVWNNTEKQRPSFYCLEILR